MNIRICTPIIGKTRQELFSNLEKVQQISDIIEIRADYIPDITSNDVAELKKRLINPQFLLVEKKGEGGNFAADETNRIQLLQNAIGLFDYVDIELSSIKEHEFKRNTHTKLIISYHNFVETPNYWDMQNIINEMNSFHPDILKVATMVNKDYEVYKIYRLLTNKPHSEERIVVGMGEYGRITRIVGPILGSYLTYAATEFGESAPGQMNIKGLKEIYKYLDYQ